MFLLMHVGALFYNKSLFERLPKFKKTIWIFENKKLQQVKKQKPAVYRDLDRFYAEHNLTEKISSGELWRYFDESMQDS